MSYTLQAACDFTKRVKAKALEDTVRPPGWEGDGEGSGKLSKGSHDYGCQEEDGKNKFPSKAR